MIDKLLSIIVPVFNSEKYLEKCIDSILNQTYKKIELILLDDGSTDKSVDICYAKMKNDSRIKLFKQENKGVAVARKVAAQLAQGQYITFVDSDDYIDYDIYEKLIPYMELSEVVTSGYYIEDKKFYDAIMPGLYKTSSEMEYLYRNMIFLEDQNERGLIPFIVNKIFITEVAKEVFQEVSERVFVGEDSEFLYRYMLKCSTCLITKECGYHYVMNENSIVHSANKNFLISVHNLYHSMENIFRSSCYHECLMLQLEKWIQSLLRQAYSFMGFTVYEDRISYISPFINTIINKQIVLYGAGKVGHDYWELLQKTQEVKVVLWVDKNWRKHQSQRYPVRSVEEIMKASYDYIIVAVNREELAIGITKELVQMGVQRETIIWKKPISTII